MVDFNPPERAHGESYYRVADEFKYFFDSSTEGKIDFQKDVFGVPFILRNRSRSKDFSGANQYWTAVADRPENTSYSTSVSTEIGFFMEREFDFDSVYEGLPEAFRRQTIGYESLERVGGTVGRLMEEVANADQVFVCLNGKNLKKITEATGEAPILPEPIVWAAKSYFEGRNRPLIIHLIQGDRLATTEVRPKLWRQRFSHRPQDQAQVAEHLKKHSDTPLFEYTKQLMRHEMTHPVVEHILYRLRKIGEVSPDIRYKLIETFVNCLEPAEEPDLASFWEAIEEPVAQSHMSSWATNKTKTDTLLLKKERQISRKKIFWDLIKDHKDPFSILVRESAFYNSQNPDFNFDPDEILHFIYEDEEVADDEKIRAAILVLFAPTGNNLEKDLDGAFPSWRQYL